MKKIIILIILNIILSMSIGILIAIHNIEITNVISRKDSAMVTVKCCGQEFDYYYEK